MLDLRASKNQRGDALAELGATATAGREHFARAISRVYRPRTSSDKVSLAENPFAACLFIATLVASMMRTNGETHMHKTIAMAALAGGAADSESGFGADRGGRRHGGAARRRVSAHLHGETRRSPDHDGSRHLRQRETRLSARTRSNRPCAPWSAPRPPASHIAWHRRDGSGRAQRSQFRRPDRERQPARYLQDHDRDQDHGRQGRHLRDRDAPHQGLHSRHAEGRPHRSAATARLGPHRHRARPVPRPSGRRHRGRRQAHGRPFRSRLRHHHRRARAPRHVVSEGPPLDLALYIPYTLHIAPR